MQNILQTNRLILRQFTTDDAAFIVELLNSPGWIQYIGDRNIKTEEQAKVYLEWFWIVLSCFT
jgi:RimJ/RimL family protein N-acetyltransferase